MNSHSNNKQHRGNEQHWQAFRYLSGELSPDERQAFEEQMLEDPSAAEALARAVEITQAVAVAEHDRRQHPLTPAKPGAPALPGLTWLAAGVAACLAIVLVLNVWGTPDRDDAAEARSAEQRTADYNLAVRWSETRQTASAELEDAELGIDAVDDNTHLPSPVESDVDALAAEPAAPDWMLAAVSGSQEMDDMMNPFNQLFPEGQEPQ